MNLPLDVKDHAFIGKKKEESGNVTYLYDEKHIAARNKGKERRLKKLSGSLKKMRTKVKNDLSHENEKIRLAALVVALIDETYERVGNEESANDLHHYGVTGWRLKHVVFGKGKATIKYVGKAGVKQNKEVKNKSVLSALKRACEGKKKNDRILDGVSAKDVNAYLEPFSVTAKDIRGYHANKEMLRSLKAAGKPPKDEKARKERFKKALEDAAKKVGHEPGTLKRQYLIPKIEQYYMEGKGIASILASWSIPLSKRAADQFLLFVGGFPTAWFPTKEEADAEKTKLIEGFLHGDSILWDYVRMESRSPFALVSMVDPTAVMPNFDALVEFLRADPRHAAFLRRYAETIVSIHPSPTPIDSDKVPPGYLEPDGLFDAAGNLPSPDMPGFDWDALAKASDEMNALIENLAGKMARASSNAPFSKRAR